MCLVRDIDDWPSVEICGASRKAAVCPQLIAGQVSLQFGNYIAVVVVVNAMLCNIIATILTYPFCYW